MACAVRLGARLLLHMRITCHFAMDHYNWGRAAEPTLGGRPMSEWGARSLDLDVRLTPVQSYVGA